MNLLRNLVVTVGLSVVCLMAGGGRLEAAPEAGSQATAGGLTQRSVGTFTWTALSPDDLSGKIREKEDRRADLYIVDIRNEFDFQKGAIEGAFNIPRKKLPFLAEKMFEKSDPIVIYGYSSNDKAAVNSVIYLIGKGYQNVMFLDGGWEAWQQGAALPVELLTKKES